MVCHGADVVAMERRAISVTLRERADNKVGFLGYVRQATPTMVQKRKGD